MTKAKMKCYILSTHRRRSHYENTYISNDARCCFKNQSRLIKQEKKHLKALLKRSISEVKNSRRLFLLKTTFTLT